MRKGRCGYQRPMLRGCYASFDLLSCLYDYIHHFAAIMLSYIGEHNPLVLRRRLGTVDTTSWPERDISVDDASDLRLHM